MYGRKETENTFVRGRSESLDGIEELSLIK